MYGGQQRQGGAVSKSINEDDFETLNWTVTPLYSDSIINAACKLPDGIAIEATRIDTGQSSEQAAASPATAKITAFSPESLRSLKNCINSGKFLCAEIT